MAKIAELAKEVKELAEKLVKEVRANGENTGNDKKVSG